MSISYMLLYFNAIKIITDNCCILHSARALRYPSIKLIMLGDEKIDLASSLSNTALMCKGIYKSQQCCNTYMPTYTHIHTHTHTYLHTNVVDIQFQLTRYVPGLKT